MKSMMTLREAASFIAAALGRKSFPEATIRTWLMTGKLKAAKVGGKRYVNQDDLQKFLPEICSRVQ